MASNYSVVMFVGEAAAHRQRVASTALWMGVTWCGRLGEPIGESVPDPGDDCAECLVAIEEASHAR